MDTTLFAWYRRGANERGYRRPLSLNIMMVVAAIIALPYYLFRSRGLSRGIAATFLFFAGMIGYTACAGVGHWLGRHLQTHP